MKTIAALMLALSGAAVAVAEPISTDALPSAPPEVQHAGSVSVLNGGAGEEEVGLRTAGRQLGAVLEGRDRLRQIAGLEPHLAHCEMDGEVLRIQADRLLGVRLGLPRLAALEQLEHELQPRRHVSG